LKNKTKKGAALIIAILAVLFVSIFGTVLLNIVTSEINRQKLTEQRVAARYLAEAGIEHGLFAFATKATFDLTIGSTYTGNIQSDELLGSYSAVYLGNRTFEASGTTSANRTVKLRVAFDSSGKITSWQEVK
jgi:Tfp pilus assembly protein PilV